MPALKLPKKCHLEQSPESARPDLSATPEFAD